MDVQEHGADNQRGTSEGTPAGELPEGLNIGGAIQSDEVTPQPKGEAGPTLADRAAAKIVWDNFQLAKAYLERNSWLMEWQATDVLYQSPNYDNWVGVRDGRPVRISRFLIAKNSNTMSNQTHRSIFGNQIPFALQPEGNTTERELEAWTHLVWVLLKRADFEYNLGLMGESQTTQGTGLARPGWEVVTKIKRGRKRKTPPQQVNLPITGDKVVNTQESDDFEPVAEPVTMSYPIFEFRRLGTTLYGPKWRTPNRPDLSAGWVINVDYVDFQDLQQLRELPCYKNIPSDETLKKFFIENPQGDAQPQSQTADQMSSQNSTVLHAEGEERQLSADPFDRPLMLLEMNDEDHTRTVLCFNDRVYCIRNDEHELGSHALGYAANWWNIENCGYGMGVGRLNSGDQRMQAGVLNEVLKMIGMWFNQPLLIPRGDNAPTQNVVAGLGTFLQVDLPANGNVRDSIAYIDKPQIPGEAWRIYETAQQGGEQLVGADQAFMQGNIGKQGSSAARTATGAQAVSSKAEDNVARPVHHLEIVITRFIEFIIEMVRNKMPVPEIRQILKKKFADEIVSAINMERFLNVEFSVTVLAGQKLIAKQAILQLIPFLLQILQQPQLLDGLHQTGRTIDFEAIEGLFIRLSELAGNDNIFRPMTPRERVMYRSSGAGQPGALQIALEQLKGANRLKAVQAKGQADITKTVAQHALKNATDPEEALAAQAEARGAGSVPLERASALEERTADEHMLAEGQP